MLLPDNLRQAILGSLIQDWSRTDPALGLSLSDIRAAADATDDWIEANTAAFNSALPEPARSVLTTSQKEFLFLAVAQGRFTR